MNYRHAYHAGNHGDVLKHALLAAIIVKLREKPAPIFILDTHAGTGTYDLTGPEAAKTEEWRIGIERVLQANASDLDPYLATVRAINPPGSLATYPGSPAIAAALMRPGDRLVLCELHPEDVRTLRNWARGKPGIAVHQRDGYEMLKAALPPPEGRGLILVDPPYEAPDELQKLGQAIVAGYRRWPGGRWLIWHPIKDRAPIWRLEETLIAQGLGNILAAELLVGPVDGVGLAGSGVLLINPPYGIETLLMGMLPRLQSALAPVHGSFAIRPLGGR